MTKTIKTEKKLVAFEESLTDWEKAEERVRAGMEQAAEREAAIESLRSELKRLVEIADRTSSEVHTILEAREEIASEREMMDAALAELRKLREQSKGLEERNKRAAELEQHAARLDALMITVGSSLETLESQREFLDQVIETAGSLRFQAKHAEALIETLREEREHGRG